MAFGTVVVFGVSSFSWLARNTVDSRMEGRSGGIATPASCVSPRCPWSRARNVAPHATNPRHAAPRILTTQTERRIPGHCATLRTFVITGPFHGPEYVPYVDTVPRDSNRNPWENS